MINFYLAKQGRQLKQWIEYLVYTVRNGLRGFFKNKIFFGNAVQSASLFQNQSTFWAKACSTTFLFLRGYLDTFNCGALLATTIIASSFHHLFCDLHAQRGDGIIIWRSNSKPVKNRLKTSWKKFKLWQVVKLILEKSWSLVGGLMWAWGLSAQFLISSGL